MELIRIFSNMGIAAIITILVSTLPLFAGGMYLFGPSERRLALMRPVSLAGIFASLSGTTLGFINTLRGLWVEPPRDSRIIAVGTAESLVPLFFGFSCLMVAWLCVAVAMRRQAP